MKINNFAFISIERDTATIAIHKRMYLRHTCTPYTYKV